MLGGAFLTSFCHVLRANVRRPTTFTFLAALATLTGLGLLPATALAAAPARPFVPWWVQNFRTATLWSGPNDSAASFGSAPQWSYLEVVAAQSGPRLYVYVPWTENYAYVDADTVGPSGTPPFLTLPPIAGGSQGPDALDWVGKVGATPAVERSAPTADASVVRTLAPGAPVRVVGWVSGAELATGDLTWAKLSDGGFAYADGLRASVPDTLPAPPVNHPSGKWIQVDLLRQLAVAYVGDEPVHLATVSTGRPGWETPLGVHRIVRRRAVDNLVGSSLRVLGLSPWRLAEANYVYLNVPYVQYFDYAGDAFHDAYWLSPGEFGTPRTHGCVGMPLREAQWFWSWAQDGTTVIVQAR